MFKKGIGIILTVCMLLSVMVPVCANSNTSFKDVPNDSPYKDGIIHTMLLLYVVTEILRFLKFLIINHFL